MLQDVDDAVAGINSKSVAGASDVTLTAAEALYGTQKYTGTLTGNINVIVPASERTYLVWNATSGSFTLTVKTSAGTGVLVPQGAKAILKCDGTNVVSWIGALLAGALYLDADNDSYIIADTDDRIDLGLSGTDLFRFDGTVSTPVNGLDFIAKATGNLPQVQVNGESTVGMEFLTQGGLEMLRLAYVASAVNFTQIEPSATGNPVKWSAFGDDSNISIRVVPKGSNGWLQVYSTESGATEGPGYEIYRDNTTDQNDGDLLGVLRFVGNNSLDARTTYAKLRGVIDDVSSTTEDGHLTVATTIAGTLADRLHVGAGVFVDGNSDPGAGGIDADAFYESGTRVARAWTYGSFDLTNGGSNDLTTANVIASIPDEVTEIDMWVDDASTNATGAILIQLVDSGGVQVAGYTCRSQYSAGGATTYDETTSGFFLGTEGELAAGDVYNGTVHLMRISSSDMWAMDAHGWESAANVWLNVAGNVPLDDDIDGVNFTTTGGSAAYDGGTVYYRYR